MEKKSETYVTEIVLGSEQILSNMLALKKYLGMPVYLAKYLACKNSGESIKLDPIYLLNSELTLDELKQELDEYEISIKTINQ